MKKFIILILCLVLTVNTIISAGAAFTSSLDVDSNIAYMISADSDATVIYNKSGDLRCDPGELTKIVTAIITIENCEDLKALVTASSEAIRSIEHLRITTAGILSGEIMTVEELLYCLLVYNANDAAVVLAEYIGGSVESFVLMMNDYCKDLGLENTKFSNPGGYQDGTEQYSTASDIANIYNKCINNAVFSEIISTFLYEIPATNRYKETRYLKNTNNLINSAISDYYFKYVKSGKSGYLSDGNANCVSFASKDGYNYICVVMDAPIMDYDNDNVDENMAFVSSKQLYSWVFENIKLRTVANTSTYVGEVSVRLSDEYDYVSLVPAENVNALVPSGVNAEGVLIEPKKDGYPQEVDAPVKKGDLLGRAEIKYAGEVIAEVDLVAAFDVSVSTSKFIGDKILKIISHPVFIIIFAVIILIALALCFISYRNKQIKRRRSRNNYSNNREKR